MLKLVQAMAPNGDLESAMARLVFSETVREYLPELVDGIELYEEQHLWIVTMWVPPSDIPEDVIPKPNADGEVASKFFLFDADSGDLIHTTFVSDEVLVVMGWLSDDPIDLSYIK